MLELPDGRLLATVPAPPKSPDIGLWTAARPQPQTTMKCLMTAMKEPISADRIPFVVVSVWKALAIIGANLSFLQGSHALGFNQGRVFGNVLKRWVILSSESSTKLQSTNSNPEKARRRNK
jgi:hypothetical protein